MRSACRASRSSATPPRRSGSPPTRRRGWRGSGRRCWPRGNTSTGDFRYPNPDGEERDYQYRYSPLLAADGTVEAVICTSRDVTEQRRAEAEAAAAHARLNAAYQRDHDIAATLQRSLLQMPLPDAFPGLEIVSRYESATQRHGDRR